MEAGGERTVGCSRHSQDFCIFSYIICGQRFQKVKVERETTIDGENPSPFGSWLKNVWERKRAEGRDERLRAKE